MSENSQKESTQIVNVNNHKFEVKPEVIGDAVSTEIKRWFRKRQFSHTLCTENVLTQGEMGQMELRGRFRDPS